MSPERSLVQPRTKPYSQEFYDEHSAGSLRSARIILRELFDVVPIKSIIDIGCGNGPWLRAAKELGAERVTGVDGDYVSRELLLIEPKEFRQCDLETEDLCQAVQSDVPADLAICVEVAEHLSDRRASSFIAEICSVSDLVLFSAAIPGQVGMNHINVQWPDYWATLFANNDFLCFDVLRPRIWDTEQCEWWYVQNVLLFAKQQTLAFEQAERLGHVTPTPLRRQVHPRMLSETAQCLQDRITELEKLVHSGPSGGDAGIRIVESKVDQLRMMMMERDNEVEALRASLENARAEYAHLRVVRDNLALENASLKCSTSWRITEPARRIVIWLRR